MQTIKPGREVNAQTVAEYNSARQEMMERIRLRDQYIGIQIGAIATAFGTAQQTTRPGGIPWFLLAVPLLSYVGLALNRSHTVVIEHLVGYLRSNFPTGYDASDYWELLKAVGRQEPNTNRSYIYAIRQRKNVLPRVSNGANLVATVGFFVTVFCNPLPNANRVQIHGWNFHDFNRVWKPIQPPIYVHIALVLALACALWAWFITHEMKTSGEYISFVQGRHTLSGVRSKSRVAVIGASGYIGRALVPFLIQRGYEVMAIDKRVSVPDSFQDGVLWLRLDASNTNGLYRFLSLYQPDTIVNLAGFSPQKLTSSDKYGKELQRVAQAIIDSMKKLKAIEGVVHISSALVYGDQEGKLSETTWEVDHQLTSSPQKSNDAYKSCEEVYRSCERTIHRGQNEQKYAATILRLFNVAGHAPGHDRGADHYPETHLIPLCVSAALGRLAKFVKYNDGKDKRDYVHVIDVCSAIHLALDDIARGGNSVKTFNVCTGVETQTTGLIELVKGKLPCTFPEIQAGEARTWDTEHRVGDNTAIVNALCWKVSRNLDQIIADEAEHQRYLLSSP